MTNQELQLLADGFGLGAYTMLLIHMVHGLVEDRRDKRAAQRQRRILAADRYRYSLLLYQLQQRSRV